LPGLQVEMTVKGHPRSLVMALFYSLYAMSYIGCPLQLCRCLAPFTTFYISICF